MKIIFAGTPEFAQVALRALHQAGFEIALVLTQPDRPAGRGMQLQASPVKQYALAQGFKVAQPSSLKSPDIQAELRGTEAELMVVAAYGLLLPQAVLDMPPKGCLNIHASLLPRWRGAAPIHRAIEAGDTETGITIMQMDAGLDTGPMLMKRALPILPKDTTGSLHDRLANLGGELIVEALLKLKAERLQAIPQPELGITYAKKIDKAEATLRWQESAAQLVQRIRAYNPFPGALGHYQGQAIKIWQASVFDADTMAEPGSILAMTAEGIVVAAGTGAVLLTELQKPGGKKLEASSFLQGFKLSVGAHFDLAA
jgi:methionyl-tRNA formyltransferase